MADPDDLIGRIKGEGIFARQVREQSEAMQQQSEAIQRDIAISAALRNDAKIQEVEREKTVANSTKAMAELAAEQDEENRRLRYLTTLLGFAVIYDVVNGSFDNHNWWTTAISILAGAVGLGGALLFGKWRTRKTKGS